MFLLLCLSPAILLILTLPLWFCKKITNVTIQIVATILFCLPMIAILLSDEVDRAGGVADFMARAFIIICMLIFSGGFLLLYDKMLHTKRCPHCCRLSLKLIRKEQEVFSHTTVRTRRYEGVRGRFVKSWETVTTFSTYNMWCPECLEYTQWETKDVDHLTSKERHVR